MSVSSVFVRAVNFVGSRKEMRVPITLLPTARAKTIATTTIIDTGATATFINLRFTQKHNIPSYPLMKPMNARVANGKIVCKITDFCLLYVQIDRRVMLGKFNVMEMGERDDILLGCPWMDAIKPEIDLEHWKVTIPRTPRSIKLERCVNYRRQENIKI